MCFKRWEVGSNKERGRIVGEKKKKREKKEKKEKKGKKKRVGKRGGIEQG